MEPRGPRRALQVVSRHGRLLPVSFLGNVARTHVLPSIHSRAFGDRGIVPQHFLCGGLTGVGCTTATL
jgi:hypothetical protein